jgi:hypothetical protein
VFNEIGSQKPAVVPSPILHRGEAALHEPCWPFCMAAAEACAGTSPLRASTEAPANPCRPARNPTGWTNGSSPACQPAGRRHRRWSRTGSGGVPRPSAAAATTPPARLSRSAAAAPEVRLPHSMKDPSADLRGCSNVNVSTSRTQGIMVLCHEARRTPITNEHLKPLSNTAVPYLLALARQPAPAQRSDR